MAEGEIRECAKEDFRNRDGRFFLPVVTCCCKMLVFIIIFLLFSWIVFHHWFFFFFGPQNESQAMLEMMYYRANLDNYAFIYLFILYNLLIWAGLEIPKRLRHHCFNAHESL